MTPIIRHLILLFNKHTTKKDTLVKYPTPGIGESFIITPNAVLTLAKVKYISAYDGTEKFSVSADAVVKLSKV